jgi:magnesium transporter
MQPTCKIFREGRPQNALTDLDEISGVLEERNALVWFDVVDPGPNDLDVLAREFGLHPLAIEDAVKAHQRPKIESYDGYWFIVVEATTTTDSRIIFHEIAIFTGRNFLVTVRHDPAFSLSEIEERWAAHPDELRRGAGYLLYTILDTVVDGYIPVAEVFQARVDEMEAGLFARHARHDLVLSDIFAMKKDAQEFRHAVMPMRDILNPIIRKDLELFPEIDIAYFRDVYDHAVRVIDQLDSLRDLMTSALEIHLSVISNRQNEVAKQLTIIATIFLPLSFITGFFGQNFGLLVGKLIAPSWTFWVFGIALELATVAVTIGYFKRQGWF